VRGCRWTVGQVGHGAQSGSDPHTIAASTDLDAGRQSGGLGCLHRRQCFNEGGETRCATGELRAVRIAPSQAVG
jgi:hypothetical protein